MAQRSPVRRTWVQAAPTRTRRPRFRWLRRGLVLLVLLTVAFLVVRAYVLAVYAPGLEAEARTVPTAVHQQLDAQGAPYVPLSQISPNLRNAIVSIEDRRFYSHPGVDPVGTVRAFFVNLVNRHIDQGGSTLEEQLVKRALIPDDRTIRAKLRTMAIAWALDRDFSKQRVLELYLNEAYYGQGAYGAQSAARVYFGTDCAHLTLPQAAFLAALPQAPSYYGADPRSAAIQNRKNTVLADMYQSGYITATQALQAQRVPLQFALPNP